MNSESEIDLQEIDHDFAFLTDHHGFQTGAPRIEGDVVSVVYHHPNMVIEFIVHHGEWQAMARPNSPTMQMQQVSLQEVLAYLAHPPIDVAADQTRPGLTQRQALAQLAGQLAPLTDQMIALFQPERWLETWQDMQAVLRERRAERDRQFVSWWREQNNQPTANWQGAPGLDAEERRVAEALKAAAEAMPGIPEEEQTPFAHPDKFFGPIGFLNNGLPSGGVTSHAPQPRRSWPFTVAEMALLLRAIDAAPAGDGASSALAAQDLAQAQQDLASRGVLQGRSLDPELAAALQTAVQPDAAFIASIVRQDQPARQVMLNRRADEAVINWVDAAGRYHFDLYPADQASAGLWRYVAYDLNELPLHPEGSASSAQRAMSAAIYTVTLAGKNLRQNRAAAFGWFIADGVLWMVQPAPSHLPGLPSPPEPQAELVDYATLEAAMHRYYHEVIEGPGV